MMYSEFTKLYGKNVPISLYPEIETLYMKSQEDKQQFVKTIKKLGLVEDMLMERLQQKEDKLQEIYTMARRKYDQSQEVLNRKDTNEKRQQADELLPDNLKYAKNNYLMALAENCFAQDVIEKFNEKK